MDRYGSFTTFLSKLLGINLPSKDPQLEAITGTTALAFFRARFSGDEGALGVKRRLVLCSGRISYDDDVETSRILAKEC